MTVKGLILARAAFKQALPVRASSRNVFQKRKMSYASAVSANTKPALVEQGGDTARSIHTQRKNTLPSPRRGNTPEHSGPVISQKPDKSKWKYPPEEYPPIVVSVWLDNDLQNHITSLRTKYFPPKRNYLEGHITFFHALPSEHLDDLMKVLKTLCDATTWQKVLCQPFKPSSSGKAVFLPLRAYTLQNIRSELLNTLSQKFELSIQDSNPRFWPHATLINKVTKEEAAAVLEELHQIPTKDLAHIGKALGLNVWYYRDGPWEHLERIPFRGLTGPRQERQ